MRTPSSNQSLLTVPEEVIIGRLLAGSNVARALAVALLLAYVSAPFLKGIVTGLAIVGAAAAFRTLLGM